jgi:hypothetical protein
MLVMPHMYIRKFFTEAKHAAMLSVANYRLRVVRMIAANGVRGYVALALAGVWAWALVYLMRSLQLCIDGVVATRAVRVVVADGTNGLFGVFFALFIIGVIFILSLRLPEKVQEVVLQTRNIILLFWSLLILYPHVAGVAVLLIFSVAYIIFPHTRLFVSIFSFVTFLFAYTLCATLLHDAVSRAMTAGECISLMSLLVTTIVLCFLRRDFFLNVVIHRS